MMQKAKPQSACCALGLPHARLAATGRALERTGPTSCFAGPV